MIAGCSHRKGSALNVPGLCWSRRPRGWALRGLPAATRWLVVAVTLAAAVTALSVPAPQAGDVALFALLAAAAAVSVEASRRIPEPAGMNANDMLAAWCVPIAVLLPPFWSLLAPVLLMALTQWRVRRIEAYKRVYSAAAIGLAHGAASAAFHALPGRAGGAPWPSGDPAVLVLAVLAVAVFAKAVNAALIGVAVKTADPEARWSGVLIVGNGRLEATEVCTGALVAVAVGVSPLLVLLALPPVLLLQRGMLYAQLHAASRTDSKTGLLNATTWEKEAAAALAATRRRGLPASVLLVDIDHFKTVNDTHGHLVGDDVLRGVANALRARLRDERDLLCRFGGEEFAAFLPGMDGVEATQAAERLRRGVAALITPAGDALVQVTVSVGVSAAAADPRGGGPRSIIDLLAGADAGLYRAKSEGRDRVGALIRPDRRAPDSAS